MNAVLHTLNIRLSGNPKGVVYNHRSSYLHSTSVCAANSIGLVDGDRVLPVVPMFHANAWGQPYAAVMAGADLLMPDKYLQANPGSDISSLKTVCCGGSTGRAGHTATCGDRRRGAGP